MRARFYTIPFNHQATKLSAFLEQSLSEIAIAFGHSFIIKNIALDDAPTLLREESALVLLLGDEKELDEAAQTLQMFAAECFISHSDRDVSLLKTDELFQGSVLSPLNAMQATLAALKGYLQASQKTLSSETPLITCEDGCVSTMLQMLQHPSKMGRLISDYHAGQIIQKTALLLSGGACYNFKTLLGNHGTVFTVTVPNAPNDPQSVSPFGMYYAVAHALQKELRLEQEANCLLSAVNNVLSATWRTRDCLTSDEQKMATTEQIGTLINEQISLVGELINHMS